MDAQLTRSCDHQDENQWLIRTTLIHDWMFFLLLDLHPGSLMFADVFFLIGKLFYIHFFDVAGSLLHFFASIWIQTIRAFLYLVRLHRSRSFGKCLDE